MKDLDRPVNKDDAFELVCAEAMIGKSPISWSESGWEKYQAIKSSIKQSLPKEKEFIKFDDDTTDKMDATYVGGYNQALAEVRKRLGVDDETI